jgi:hypothetical protein
MAEEMVKSVLFGLLLFGGWVIELFFTLMLILC